MDLSYGFGVCYLVTMNQSDPLVLLYWSGILYLNFSVLDNDVDPPAVFFFHVPTALCILHFLLHVLKPVLLFGETCQTRAPFYKPVYVSSIVLLET